MADQLRFLTAEEELEVKEEKIVYHEIGHFVISFLVRKLRLHEKHSLAVDYKNIFSLPTYIIINAGINITGKGAVGFNSYPPPNPTEFYSKYLEFAFCGALIALAGHVFDFKFTQKEFDPSFFVFGKDWGEENDKKQFDEFAKFFIPQKYRRKTQEYISKYDELVSKIKSLILEITNFSSAKKMVHLIATTLINKVPDENGEKRLKGEELNQIFEIMNAELKNIPMAQLIENCMLEIDSEE
ncbi:MAG: hypothetical protein DHS20C13_25390 [Thermodesulfobacteriota bacterium]|nr:MAG: hypothetical protein DHS20C13_25390 [Thermodesulfobacteriota bacterium]GJM36346.1 MAG: hypothetical protein DHS20C18_53470 [Saprospiraceae bacterium]